MLRERKRHDQLGAWLGAAAALLSAVWLARRARQQGRGRAPEKEPEAWLQLRVLTGEAKGEVHRFVGSHVATVGRRDSNAVCLRDTGVSGRHLKAWFDAEARAWHLVDLGSTNGTLLNKCPVVTSSTRSSAAHTLCTGDRIQLGEDTEFAVTCEPSGASPTDSQTVGDLTAVELINGLLATPLPHAIRASQQTIELPELRARACVLQKQAAQSRNKTQCEDTFSHFTPAGPPVAAALCVADGHCGAETSADVQQLLPGILAERLRPANGDAAPAAADASLHAALAATFAELDRRVDGQDGSTLTTLLLRRGAAGAVHLQAANVGDSAVVCADFKRMVKYHLTDDHRVTAAAELARLRAAGALLTHRNTRLMGLNLSRSIGDRALKERNPGLLAEPYISKVHTVPAGEALLAVLASDGLWDVTNANLVMRVAYKVLADHPGDVQLLCEVLMEHAIRRRSRDDITIVVLHIDAAAQ